MHRLVRGEILMRRILEDTAAAVDTLQTLAGTSNIGVLGHSYGGNVALFAAALDTRLTFAVSSGAACSYAHKLARGVGLEMGLVIPAAPAHARPARPRSAALRGHRGLGGRPSLIRPPPRVL
jgi:predicted alpha/beta hydrolase